MFRFFVVLMTLLLTAPALAQTPDRPLQVLHALGCKSCHRFRGQGGTFARPLDPRPDRAVAARQLARQLTRPARHDVAMPMPPYLGLTAEQLRALTTLLTPQAVR